MTPSDEPRRDRGGTGRVRGVTLWALAVLACIITMLESDAAATKTIWVRTLATLVMRMSFRKRVGCPGEELKVRLAFRLRITTY